MVLGLKPNLSPMQKVFFTEMFTQTNNSQANVPNVPYYKMNYVAPESVVHGGGCPSRSILMSWFIIVLSCALFAFGLRHRFVSSL